jgi:hypothetical protein
MNANIISHHLFVAALSNDARAAVRSGAAPNGHGNGAETAARISRQLARALAAAESGRGARLRLGTLSLGHASDSRSNP